MPPIFTVSLFFPPPLVSGEIDRDDLPHAENWGGSLEEPEETPIRFLRSLRSSVLSGFCSKASRTVGRFAVKPECPIRVNPR